MALNKISEIVRNKKGIISHFSEDIFEASDFICEKGHKFKHYNNDIVLGKWCQECKDKIHPLEEILISLGLTYGRDYKLESYNFFAGVLQPRRYLFSLTENKKTQDEEKLIAKKYDFSIIFALDYNKEKIWEYLKENKSGVIEKEIKISSEHKCHIEEKIGEKGESSSTVKRAPKPWPENFNKAKGYIRVSTVMQVNDGFSLEAQESKIAQECLKHNLYLTSFYIDKGISGGSTEKRLALEKLRNELEENTWIIVTSVSRLARNTKDLLQMVEEIEAKKCHLIIIDLNLDITSPSGKLILTLMASQAQFERELTSERVKGVLEHLKATGNLRTKPKFGWKLNPDRSQGAPLHIRDEKEQKVIQKIRFLREEHQELGITAFTRLLNDSDVKPPRSSKVWYHGAVRKIMNDEGIK
jgi:site-specific DNA recombinase